MGRRRIEENKNIKIGKGKIVFGVFALIYVVLSVIFYINITRLNLLPFKYNIILALALLLFTIGISCGIFAGKKKSLVRRIIFTIIAMCIVVAYIFGINYISATTDFMDAMSEELVETEEYYIVTLDNGRFNGIEDINGKNLHVFSSNEDYSDVKKNISDKAKVIFKEDESLITLAKDILSFKSHVALVSSSQYSMICDELTEFDEKTKIIYTAEHKINGEVASEIKEEESPYTIDQGKFNIYISGIDTSGSITNVARSDANIVVSINTNTREVLLTSIPRDYYVVLHSKGAKDKLTHSGVYGINETVSTVEDLLGIDINYYVRVNFSTVIKLVDTLGGIDVNSEYAFKSYTYSYRKGMNHLNGKQALEFARERYTLPGGDRQRIKNQQAVITAILNKVLSSTTILTKYSNILSSLKGYFQTNINQDDISMLVREQLNDMRGWNIKTVSLDGTGANKTTYSYGRQLLYVMEPTESTVINAQNEINALFE